MSYDDGDYAAHYLTNWHCKQSQTFLQIKYFAKCTKPESRNILLKIMTEKTKSCVHKLKLQKTEEF